MKEICESCEMKQKQSIPNNESLAIASGLLTDGGPVER